MGTRKSTTTEKYANFIKHHSEAGTVFKDPKKMTKILSDAKLSSSFIYDARKIGITKDASDGFTIKPNIFAIHAAKKMQNLNSNRYIKKIKLNHTSKAKEVILSKQARQEEPLSDQALVDELRKRGYDVICSKSVQL